MLRWYGAIILGWVLSGENLNIYKYKRGKDDKMNAKLLIPIFILVLLSVSVLAQVSTDTSIMNQINERLERNKAEIIKAVKDAQAQSQNSTQTFIDSNFEVLDTRIQEFLKAAKRDMAIIMLVTFLVGFTLSQILKISIERKRRATLIKRAMELDVAVERLSKEAGELSAKVRQLKVLDETYSKELKSLAKKEPFITLKMVLFGVITLLLGVIITYFLAGGK